MKRITFFLMLAISSFILGEVINLSFGIGLFIGGLGAMIFT